jgi:GNAT superfamily N-acetyltransferase
MLGKSVNDLEIRPFQPGDEDDFRYLNEEWITRYFRLEAKDREMLGQPQAILDSGGQIMMAVSGLDAVGCCALVPMGNDSFEISKMAVTASQQNRGIGRRLLTAIIQEGRRFGAKRFYIETNSKLHPAIRLYESLGFRQMSPDQITPSPYERADVYMELLS